MKCNILTTAIMIVGLPSLTFAAAQQPGAPPKQERDARTATTDDGAYYAAVSKLIGANVWSRPDTDGDRDDLADINDFIVDAESGKVDFVILSSGGIGSVGDSLRRVNFSDLTIEHTEGDECKVMMNLSEDEFGRIAKVEEKSLEPYRAKTVAASFRDRQTKAREAAGKEATAGVREAQMRATGAILASELDDFDVRASMHTYDADGKPIESEKFGSVDEAWINIKTGKLEYLTLDYKDRMVVFPHRALISHVDVDGKQLYFVAPVAADRLMQAPAFDEAKNWNLRNEEFRQTIDKFYVTKNGDVGRVGGESSGSGK